MRNRAIVILLAVTLSACSSAVIFYNLADEFLEREVAFYLDLEDGEDDFVAERIREFMSWHRANMLPAYAQFLRTQADIIEAGGMNSAAADIFMARTLVLYEDTVAGFTPRAAAILARHTDAGKVANLRRRMAFRLAEKLAETGAPEAARIAQRTERIVMNFERFTGDLNDIQEAIIRRYAAANLGDRARRLNNLGRRQEALADYLKTKPDPAALVAFLQKMLLRPHEIVDPGYREFARARRGRIKTLLLEVLDSLTKKQKVATAARLRGFAEDFTQLAERG